MRAYDKRSSGTREVRYTSNNVAQLFDLLNDQDGRLRVVEKSVGGILSTGFVSGGGVVNYHAVWNSPTSIRPSNHVYDDNVNNRTGYGTTTPANLVHLYCNNATDLLETADKQQLIIQNAGAGDAAIGYEVGDGTKRYSQGIDNSDSDKFKLWDITAAQSIISYKSTGIESHVNLGVGVSPLHRLHVYENKNGPVTGYFINPNAGNAAYADVVAVSDAEFTIMRSYSSTFPGTYAGINYASMSLFYSQGSTSLVIAETGPFPIYFTTDAVIRMTILGTGNIGIGVSDPDTKLEVFHTGVQQKWSYNATDNLTLAVDDDGKALWTPSGGMMYLPDNTIFEFGSSKDDLSIGHWETYSMIENMTGDLKIRCGLDILFQNDVDSTIFSLDASEDCLEIASGKSLFLPDNTFLHFGNTDASPDVQLKWDTTPTTDSLLLYTPNFIISDTDDVGAEGFVDIYQAGCPSKHYLLFRNGLVSHGMTDYLPASAFGLIDIASESYGGVKLIGASENNGGGGAVPMAIYGITTTSCTGGDMMKFVVGEESGAGLATVGDGIDAFCWYNYTTLKMRMRGDGSLQLLGTDYNGNSYTHGSGAANHRFLLVDQDGNLVIGSTNVAINVS